MGGCTLSNVRRGVTQTCSLGYWIGERFARQGYMYDAVCALVPFIFKTLGLQPHRSRLPAQQRGIQEPAQQGRVPAGRPCAPLSPDQRASGATTFSLRCWRTRRR